MPRIPRMVMTDSDQKVVYHIISRTALDGLPFNDSEKDNMVRLIQRYSSVYAVDVFGYAIMGNHFHLLVEMQPESSLSDEDVRKRFHLLYGKSEMLPESLLNTYRRRFCSLSDYVKDIKQTFSRYYNRCHERKGTLWSERFKSVIVEQGNTVTNCLAYIDLNPVRAGIVMRPEEYRWCSMAYHVQTGNRGQFLSQSFGLEEVGNDSSERMRIYREFLYHAGSMVKEGKAHISKAVLDEVSGEGFKMSASTRLGYRTRYFTESGAIGSKAFVSGVFEHFKGQFNWNKKRVPKRVAGIEGMYSLKRLSEA